MIVYVYCRTRIDRITIDYIFIFHQKFEWLCVPFDWYPDALHDHRTPCLNYVHQKIKTPFLQDSRVTLNHLVMAVGIH